MELSIVTTLYLSSPYVVEFYKRIRSTIDTITEDYEIIFVNDGSPDDSLACALGLQKEDARIKVIDLSRNFGQHKAMMSGLMHAKGDKVFLIDCDLEEEPELLKKFYTEMKASEADVVYGVRKNKGSAFSKRLAAYLSYKFFNLISYYPLPDNPLNARLMSQQYVKCLLKHREREFYMAGLWAITGFRQVAIPVTKHSKGKSSYTFRRKIAVFVNAVTSFSNVPLIFIFYLGCIIMLISSLAALLIIIRKLFFGGILAGWSSLLVSIWLLSGVIIFSLGVIGIYISKIFIETKQRPYVIVKQIYDNSGPDR